MMRDDRAERGRRGGRRRSLGRIAASALALAVPSEGWAHDIEVPVRDLELAVQRVEKTLVHYQSRPVLEAEGADPRAHRLALGAAEIDFALGDTNRALRTLLEQIEAPDAPGQPEQVSALLLASEILERTGDDFGAMNLARRALEVGGEPEAMAEAGARWFRLARRWQRLEPRREVFRLWQRQGGTAAADAEVVAAVRYEAAFALRAEGRRAAALDLLRVVPSGSPHGSRAAYLAGVIHLERGDLANAERWFSAIMEWPIPSSLAVDPAGSKSERIEREVRALAALSAARLRYERGALEPALEAYGRVPETSSHFAEACWEQAYLTLELERPRASLDHLRCVTDLGVGGLRRVDARLFRASLEAHLERYASSLEQYDALFEQFRREFSVVDRFLRRLDHPAEFLFGFMERAAADSDGTTALNPSTFLADAWTPEVDAAYRVTASARHTADDVEALATTVEAYRGRLDSIDAFPEVEFRRSNLERLLVEIDHLLSHAGELDLSARADADASAWAIDLGPRADRDGHPSARARVADLTRRLRQSRDGAQDELTKLTRRAEAKLQDARAELDALASEIESLRRASRALRAQARPLADEVAESALEDVRRHLSDARMRAEVGVLDTFWIRKQQRTRDIEDLLRRKKEQQTLIDEAARGADAGR